VLAHCRRYGTAKIGIQLAHAGRKASARRPGKEASRSHPRRMPGRPSLPRPSPSAPPGRCRAR
jgi:2,4-dienoyl-CoA reductase-like NADH-dependent reductase (Old Yellow Enzyme family)